MANVEKSEKVKTVFQSKYWVFRVVDTIPLPYWLTCILYGLVLFCIMYVVLTVAGADVREPLYIRSLILVPFLAAYMTALCPLISSSTRRMVGEMKHNLYDGAPTERFNAEIYTLDSRAFWFWLIVFQCISLVSQLGGIERTEPGH